MPTDGATVHIPATEKICGQAVPGTRKFSVTWAAKVDAGGAWGGGAPGTQVPVSNNG
jgi:hypothetical protein